MSIWEDPDDDDCWPVYPPLPPPSQKPDPELPAKLRHMAWGIEAQMPPVADLMRRAGAEIKHLKQELRNIAAFGSKNTGCGFTCAKMAEEGLRNE